MHTSSCRARAIGNFGVLLAALLPSVVWASCAPPPELVLAVAAGPAAGLRPGQAALAKNQDWQREAQDALNVLLDESDTDAALALAADGAALYQREEVKKSGYSYCG